MKNYDVTTNSETLITTYSLAPEIKKYTLHDKQKAFDDLKKRTAVECEHCRGLGFTLHLSGFTTITKGKNKGRKKFVGGEKGDEWHILCTWCDEQAEVCAYCSGHSKSCECGEEE